MAGTSSGRSVDVKSGVPDTPPTTSKSATQSKPRKKLSPADKTAMSALATLIEDIAAHNSKAAFKKLFEYFAPRLKGYLMRLGSSEAQAEELVQDVMLTVWRKAALFDRRKAAASTWLFTIARNRRIDILRREKYPELDPEDPALVPDEEVQPDDAVIMAERKAEVQSALATLPEEQIKLVKLAFYKGWSHSEIAKETGLPLGTVKSRLRLSFTRLKEAIDGKV
ncbi:MAG: sigma-70 family RNA polymerase sigma factor [Pseudomonadota bacterium]|nr:sigma-70 family RNA polymerase sigma factor [Pseudomonadota bacterium]